VANIKAADNKLFYLMPGKYIIKFTAESLTTVQENFEIVK